MVASLTQPLAIFVLGLGGGFLIPLVAAFAKRWASAFFVALLAAMTAVSGVCLIQLVQGAAPFEILTGGSTPPYSINLRMGLTEAFAATSVNLLGLLGARYFLREKYPVLLLYLLVVMGIQGMVMTRDLFNLFVFLEIVSIAAYGLLALGRSAAALASAFKFLMATIIASTFFLLGTMLLYAVTGLLNIDALLAARETIAGTVGFAGLMLLLACLLLELKPFPANGWGLDVYETAPGAVAAIVASGISAGVFFALYNLFPLFAPYAAVIAVLGVATFVISNLIGLTQTKAQRLLGYSSVGQMGLLTAALALLHLASAKEAIPLVIGGLFVNHLFAKAGLFWLAGIVGVESLEDWSQRAWPYLKRVAFGILLCALAGLPPFPGFFAKWQLMLTLAESEAFVWIGLILLGSLFEVAYLFRWFGQSLHREPAMRDPRSAWEDEVPIFGAALLLLACGFVAAKAAGAAPLWIYLPLAAGALIALFDDLSGRIKCLIVLALLAGIGTWLVQGLSGIGFLFATLLLAGSLTLTIACLYRTDKRPGFYPFLIVMLLSLCALPRAATSLEFVFLFELVSLASYFLIVRHSDASADAFRYLLFAIASGFFLIAGFALAYAATGSTALDALMIAGPTSGVAFVLLAAGFLIKAAAIGVHVWLPGAYANADDDLTAMLSAVVSKMAIFGLLVGTYVAVLSQSGLGLEHAVAWIGMLTALIGVMLAVQQDDVKRLLAYSSMSQLGYIVTAIALMSHLGWVTALYLTANHLAVKGILFLAAAAIILRTGTREITGMGGLARQMKLTFAAAAFAIVAMSGLPPLAGFGGKWLLLSAMMEKEWYGVIGVGLLATFVGFLYMARFLQAIFLDRPAKPRQGVAEAPAPILVAQSILILGILVMSFLPKLLIEPISAAIDPYFASTLVWEGMSLEMIYGTWDPVPVMLAAVGVSALLFGVLWLMRSHGLRAQGETRPLGFYAYFKPAFVWATPPLATRFWRGTATSAVALGDSVRKVYSGDGQTYALYVLYYFVTLYVVCATVVQLNP